MAYKRLGEILTDAGAISEEELGQALKLQKGSGKRLGTVLMDNGFITEASLINALHTQLGIDFIDLSETEVDPKMVKLLPGNLAKKYRVIPVRLDVAGMVLAMEDPLDFMAIEAVRSTVRRKIIPVIATSAGIRRAYNILYENEGAVRAMAEMSQRVREMDMDNPSIIEDEDETSPTVRLVNSIIERGVTERASDIHVEPGQDKVSVRIRVDGRLVEILTIPKDLQQAVFARFKIVGGMDVVERRIPQDGRAAMTVAEKEVDLRLSTLPTIFGEKLVIRILTKNEGMLTRDGIGMTGDNQKKFERLLRHNSGVILIVGPTGSGKSSTMYTMIRELKSESVNLIMLEDPVEYKIEGVTQVPINEKTGMTFSSALRSVLRQDPDIIGVGEIRDGETAEIAMRAAMTGHLVITTIHTEDAVSALDRLKDMGVEPYLIAGAIRGIVSQRLVRKICPNCGRLQEPTRIQKDLVGIPEDSQKKFYVGSGCPMCLGSGYHGRIGVFEILTLNRRIRDCITDESPKAELRKAIAETGFVPMIHNGMELAEEGITSIEELCRTISIVDA